MVAYVTEAEKPTTESFPISGITTASPIPVSPSVFKAQRAANTGLTRRMNVVSAKKAFIDETVERTIFGSFSKERSLRVGVFKI
jgi:hypothetical protein